MSLAEALGAAVYLVALAASASVAGAALSRWTDSDALDRALVATVAGASVLVGTALILGMTGTLTRQSYVAAVVAVGGVAAVWIARSGRPRARIPAAWTLGGLAALGIGGILASLGALPTVRGARMLEPETRQYHLSNLVAWVRDGSIWDLPYQSAGYFTATHPGNGELLGAGPLLATGGIHLVFASTIVFGALAVLSGATIARELDARPELGALAMLALVATPGVLATQSHSLTTDLVAAAGLLAGVAALMRARRERDRRWVVVAGAALGLGLGANYSVLLLTCVVLAGAVVVLRPRRRVAWMAPGLVLFAGPWFLRNALATGNPIFPQGVSIGGREIMAAGQSQVTELSTTLLHHMVAGRLEMLDRWSRIAAELYGPALILGAAGIVMAVVGGQRSRERLAIAALAVAAAVVYAATPYTGGGPDGLILMMISGQRHLMAAAALAAALAAAVLPRRLFLLLVVVTFGFSAYWRVVGYSYRPDLRVPFVGTLLAALAGILLTAAVVSFGQRRFGSPAAFAAVAILAVAPLTLVLIRADERITHSEISRAVEATGSSEVISLGVRDSYSLLGPNLDVRLGTLTSGSRAGERPITDLVQLDQALAATDVDVLAFIEGTPATPEGWSPPGDWILFAQTPQGDVYVRSR